MTGTWRKFCADRQALLGLIFITLVTLAALLGYLITPDSSPQANAQQVNMAAQPPLFTVQMLCVKKNMTVAPASLFSKMLYGQTPEYQEIPVANVQRRGTLLLAEEYGSGATPRILTFAADEVVAVVQKRYLLGTDRLGRDLLSRLIIGARISLAVGAVSVAIALLLGVSLGAIAGYFGGKIDLAIMWFTNVTWSIPTLLMVIAITMALGKGFWQIFVAVGLTIWVDIARLVRGQVMSVRQKEYVEAARALGYSHGRIIFKHILPNVMSPVIVMASANFASAILVEAGLNFLGIGAQPPAPSWGGMTREHSAYIMLDAAHLALIPGIAIVLTVLAFTFVGNGLRNATDSRNRGIL